MMKFSQTNFVLPLMALAITLCFTSCDDDDSTTPQQSVQLRTDATLGSVMTDAEGMTLYFFSWDHRGTTSECEGQCLDNWPIFYTENLELPTGLNAADFGQITHPSGVPQTTYKGWPLYYYVNDTEAGQTNGEGRADVWFVAKPDYDIMYVAAQLVGRNFQTGNKGNVIVDDNGDYVNGDGRTFYMVDDRGNTLYSFATDSRNTNTFTMDNDPMSVRNMAWPVAQIDARVVPSVFDIADFGSIEVQGWTQMTYKGWPIYFYGTDMMRGDNLGVGYEGTLGAWPIANPGIEAAN